MSAETIYGINEIYIVPINDPEKTLRLHLLLVFNQNHGFVGLLIGTMPSIDYGLICTMKPPTRLLYSFFFAQSDKYYTI